MYSSDKNCFCKIIIPKQKNSGFSVGGVSAVLSEGHASVSKEILRMNLFFREKIFSFCCSIKQFRVFWKNGFCSAVNSSFYLSGEVFRRNFFSKENQSQKLFWILRQIIPSIGGNPQAVLSEVLVALPGGFSR